MMPSVGGFELVVIAIVALLVVGPKDLPVLMRKVGAFMGRMRAMAADFRASFDEMARQSELDDLRREVEALRSGRMTSPLGRDAEVLVHEIDEGLRSGPDHTPPPLPDFGSDYGDVPSPDSVDDAGPDAAALDGAPALEAPQSELPESDAGAQAAPAAPKKPRRKKTA